jgi:DNA polymerase-3 subunit gamma/tau
VQPPSDPVVQAPAAAPTAPVAGEPDAAAIRRQWSTVLDKVRERSRSLAVMLAGAVVRTVDGGTLMFNHESAPLAKRLNEQRNADVVEEALKDALGVGLKVRFEVGSATEPTAAATSAEAVVTQVQRDEEDMLAEAGSDSSEIVRRDPEEAALELLQNELGARRIDGG